MKKKYTIGVFIMAFFFLILGKLIDLKIFGTDVFGDPNGERYNELKLYIFLPITFIIIGVLILSGLFNKLFDSMDRNKEEQKRKLLEWEELQKENREKELIAAKEKENIKLMESEMELEKFKDLNFTSAIIKDLETRTDKAGNNLISAGNQFIYSIVLTFITLIISTIIAMNSKKANYEIIITLSLLGSVISFILVLSAISDIKEAGMFLKSKKNK